VYIIIDGCNVLFQGNAERTISQGKRRDFLEQLVQYTFLKKHEIVVVFDGGLSARPQLTRYKTLEVWDAGFSHSADDCICRIFDRLRNVQNVLLVSSDNELNTYAENLDIVSIESALFKRLVYRAIHGMIATRSSTSKSAQKGDFVVYGSNSPELDALMMSRTGKVFDKDARSKQEKPVQKIPLLGEKLHKSKLERRLEHILEKL
jgi:predicted RNA-binding protein with PIN domain